MANRLVQQKFGEAAADYAASSVHARGESIPRLIAMVEPQPDWRALDIATGAGHTAHALAPLVAHVVASDITDPMLAEAGKLAAAKGLQNFETARAEAEALPFADESFDLVTCRLAAHHFPHPVAFVGEVWRVLKPGGAFALVDNIGPDSVSLPGASDEALVEAARIYNAYEKLRDPSHGRCLALAEWIGLMTATGFADVRYERMDQHIAFGPWLERMRCSAETAAELDAMLKAEPLHTLLAPREGAEGRQFTLQEAIIVARKPL